jgi:branched-chain amino acid transport system ATP-binding protein
MSQDQLLEIDDIVVTIDRATVLDGVSLEVAPGETVALIGRNGAGKTTTFRTVMGQTSIQSGSVRVNGTDLTSLPSRTRIQHGIGFAPEDRRLFTTLTVEDNIRMSTWGKGGVSEVEFEKRRQQILETFPEMEQFFDRPAGQLSGGQQKMVTVGRALASDPDIVLLDEPFEGLAPSVRERFRNGVERIKELNISIVVAESNVRHAGEIADRAYVLERGEIVAKIENDEAITDNADIKRIFEGA